MPSTTSRVLKKYLIIGASSGIGRKITELLVAQGDTVIGTYYSNNTISSTAGLEMHYYDVKQANRSPEFIPDILDGLIYCPGKIALKPFSRIRLTAFTDDFNFQVVGALEMIQSALPALKKSQNASILTFSTVAVQTGFPFHSIVSASKGAIEGVTRALAAEFSPQIRVNCIAPSLTDTPLAARLLNTESKRATIADRNPLKIIGQADDIAEMSAFLVSDKAKWITGQIIHVDGGVGSLKVG